MDALTFVTLMVCLFPNEPAKKVCSAVTLKEPFATIELCESGWEAAVKRWAGPHPAVPYASRLLGCGPAPEGTPEDVPAESMLQGHEI